MCNLGPVLCMRPALRLQYTSHIRRPFDGTIRRLTGLYTGFLPRDPCQKEGGEAVRSCRAAAGGWVQEGDVPPPAIFFYLSEIHLHEL